MARRFCAYGGTTHCLMSRWHLLESSPIRPSVLLYRAENKAHRQPVATSRSLIHHQVMRIQMGTWALVCAGILLWVPLSVPSSAQADLVGDVRSQLAQNSFSAAESELRTYKGQHGVTPEYLEALSWMAREAASTKRWDQADAYA